MPRRMPRGAGVNRVYWDLRYEPLPAPPASRARAAAEAGFGAAALLAPNVLPGEYRVTLVVAGKEIATKPLRVSGDSALPMSDADRKTWHDTTLSLHQLQRAANDAADAVTTLGTQLTTAESLLKTAGSAPSGGKQAVEEAASGSRPCARSLASVRPAAGAAASAAAPTRTCGRASVS